MNRILLGDTQKVLTMAASVEENMVAGRPEWTDELLSTVSMHVPFEFEAL